MDRVRTLGNRKLLMGDEMTVTDSTITIGPATVDFRRPVTDDDIKAVFTIYVIGSAARCRFVDKAYETFVRSFEPVSIMGYREEGDADAQKH